MSFIRGFNSAVSRVLNSIFKKHRGKSFQKKRNDIYENSTRNLNTDPAFISIRENSSLYNTANLRNLPVITRTVIKSETVIRLNDYYEKRPMQFQPQPQRQRQQQPPLKREISSKSIDYINYSCLSEEDITEIEDKFNNITNNGKLTVPQFKELYNQVRTEDPKRLEKVSEILYNTFDIDKDGVITLDEFLTGYAITNCGSLKKKLEFLFQIYDRDGDGFLSRNEIQYVIEAIIGLFDVELELNASEVAKECIRDLDQNDDGKITKEEFTSGLMKNYALRSLMSPFN